MKRPTGPVEIRRKNALDYPTDPDNHYRVADITKHLKLRVLKTGTRNWEYDYIWEGRRQKHSFSFEEYTPAQARDAVNGWEYNRKVEKRDPFTKSSKGVSLASFLETYLAHKRIKPHTNKDGITTGISKKEHYERRRRFNKHFANSKVGTTSLLQLTEAQISKWYDNMAADTPSEAVNCLFLGSHMMKYALKEYDTLRKVMGNKFDLAVDRDDLTDDKNRIKEKRKKRPITAEEWKALDKTCKEYPDQLAGLLVRFIMATTVRGKHAIELRKDDIVEEDGNTYFRHKFKRTWDTVVLAATAKAVYLEILKLHKEEGWITDWLFPSRDMTGGKTGGVFRGLRDRSINSDDKAHIFVGRDGVGGIRGAAAKIAPSLLGVKAKTTADKEQYGEWKTKPVGLHDVRDTMATGADTIEEATAMLQNTSIPVTKESYREVQIKEKIKVAKNKEKIIKELLKIV